MLHSQTVFKCLYQKVKQLWHFFMWTDQTMEVMCTGCGIMSWVLQQVLSTSLSSVSRKSHFTPFSVYPVHLGSLHLIHCPNIYILCSESFLTSSMWKRFLDCTFILRLSISLLKGMMFSLLLVSFNTPVRIFVHLSISFLLSFFDTSNLLVLKLLYQVYFLSSYIHFECWTFLMSWLNHIY